MSNTLFSKRGIIGGLIAIAIAVGAVVIAYWFITKDTSVPDNQITLNSSTIGSGIETGEVHIGAAPYSLLDMNGQTLTQDSFPNKYKIVFFGFTNCEDECPIAMHNMAEALSKLGGQASKIQMIFISVDPKRDTLDVIRKWLANFDSRIVGATGTEAQIKKAEDSFRAYASDGNDNDVDDDKNLTAAGTSQATPAHHHQDNGAGNGDEVNHSDNIYFLSPQNNLLNVFNGDIDGPSLANEIQMVLTGAVSVDGNTTVSDAPPPSDTAMPENSAALPSDNPNPTTATK